MSCTTLPFKLTDLIRWWCVMYCKKMGTKRWGWGCQRSPRQVSTPTFDTCQHVKSTRSDLQQKKRHIVGVSNRLLKQFQTHNRQFCKTLSSRGLPGVGGEVFKLPTNSQNPKILFTTVKSGQIVGIFAKKLTKAIKYVKINCESSNHFIDKSIQV